MHSEEQWREVPGFEGRYQVSSEGHVRSLCRRAPVLMRADVRPDGHWQVKLTSDHGYRRNYFVHYLVLLAFVADRSPGLDTRHLDGDPANNALRNLCYGTRAENRIDDVRHGKHNNARKTHCPAGHRYDEANTYRPPARPRARHCRRCQAERGRRASAELPMRGNRS